MTAIVASCGGDLNNLFPDGRLSMADCRWLIVAGSDRIERRCTPARRDCCAGRNHAAGITPAQWAKTDQRDVVAALVCMISGGDMP